MKRRISAAGCALIVAAACTTASQTQSPLLTQRPASSTPAAAPPLATEHPSPTVTDSDRPDRSASLSPSSRPEFSDAWTEFTQQAIGATSEYTNRLELADIDGDGMVDILFANGGNYDSPGEPEASRAFVNLGDAQFEDATQRVFGDFVGLTRVIKARDLNKDGHVDILLGTTYNGQSRLLVGNGNGDFVDRTDRALPVADLSVGDAEIGDVDADGDLDIVLVDWGDVSPLDGQGPLVLWLNDGSARFIQARAEATPATLIGFSWDIELVDVDNDWDLDVAVSCKVCSSSLLYENDGEGTFTDVTAGRMPAFRNNYDFAPIDLDGDGYLDLVTINDGSNTSLGSMEHVFRNDRGAFSDATTDWWPAAANPGYDDAVVTGLDFESDGDADFLIASLDGPDRLLINDGSGRLSMLTSIFDASPSLGSLDMGLADLNGDGRLDVVESQGEVPGNTPERVYFATDVVPPDTAPPVIRTDLATNQNGPTKVQARIHDNRSVNMPLDWQLIEVRWGSESVAAMTWYGENLFRATIDLGSSPGQVQVCAVDAAGNEACAS